MNVAPLPEISERSATGKIAEIYQALRDCLGIPNVNLVFRHMATVPGCLPWAWQCLAPLYRTTGLHMIADELIAVAYPSLELKKRTLFGHDTDQVIATLDSYIRANPINMLGLSALAEVLDADGQRAPISPTSSVSRVTPIPKILPMADLAELPANAIDRLRELAVKIHGEEGPVIPSVFRHFAHSREALDVIDGVVTELVRSGKMDQLGMQMLKQGRAAIARLDMNKVELPDFVTTRTIRLLANLFPANMAKMTIVALALRATWCA